MTQEHKLDGFDMTPVSLEREWVVTVDTPIGGVEPVAEAVGRELPLVYDELRRRAGSYLRGDFPVLAPIAVRGVMIEVDGGRHDETR